MKILTRRRRGAIEEIPHAEAQLKKILTRRRRARGGKRKRKREEEEK